MLQQLLHVKTKAKKQNNNNLYKTKANKLNTHINELKIHENNK